MSISYKNDYLYAAQRLNGTIVKYEDEPVVINNIAGNGVVTFYSLVNNGRGDEPQYARLDELSLEPIRLGYLNTTNSCSYIKRLPARVQRQGLQDRVIVGGGRVQCKTPAFINCVMGIYPSLDMCVDSIVNGEVKGRAFTRQFALFKEGDSLKLWYKDRTVGGYNKREKKLVLKEEFKFLEEVLERAKKNAQ